MKDEESALELNSHDIIPVGSNLDHDTDYSKWVAIEQSLY
jgi:hypothetical protein